MDVISALREHSEAGAAIVELLYGDMGEEVAKSIAEFGKAEQKRDTAKTVAQVSNVVGLAAGAAATPGAIAAVRPAYRKAMGKPVLGPNKTLRKLGGAVKSTQRGRKLLRVAKNPKVALGLAGGGAALQAGNLGGDFVTSRVLGRKETSKSLDIGIYTEISKVDEDKRQIFGWASVTSIGGQPVLDLQDDILPLEEIEKAAYSFVEKSRVGGNMHQKHEAGPIHVSDMIESFVVTPEKKKAMGLPDDFPEGWWTGFKVNDDATWADAKSGKLAGLSIHGSGRRIPVEAF